MIPFCKPYKDLYRYLERMRCAQGIVNQYFRDELSNHGHGHLGNAAEYKSVANIKLTEDNEREMKREIKVRARAMGKDPDQEDTGAETTEAEDSELEDY